VSTCRQWLLSCGFVGSTARRLRALWLWSGSLIHILTTQKSRNVPNFVGESDAIKAIRNLVPVVAASNSTVLITGESGTGKEIVARSLHELSPRAGANFVPINCAALPKDLIESLLFGH